MAYNFKSEEEVKLYIHNLGIEYRFGCYSEKKPEVCHLLGDYLEGIKKEFKKASKIYKNNCDEYNYPRSCTKFAKVSLLGRGLEKQDTQVAYQYFEKGCALNEADSCLHQGLLLVCDNKDEGIAQDISKGMEILEKSCMLKNSHACYYLSGIYLTGLKKPNVVKNLDEPITDEMLEVKKNMVKAHKYALEGCQLGNMYCCVNVSQMYEKGEGVEKNQKLAEQFKKIASEMQYDLESNKTLKFQQGL